MSTSRSVAVSGGMSWTRVRTPRWMARIAKVLFLAAGTAQLAVLLDLFWFGPLGAMAGAFAFFLFLASYILSLTQTSFAGTLEIEALRRLA